MLKRYQHVFLVGFLVLTGLLLRLYKINTPLADWHSWRQADTASVTREFVNSNYPIWEPHYHDLSNIPNGLENPQGYRMVEFPIVNYLTAQLLKAQPQLDLVLTSRLVSISFSLISIISLYGIVLAVSKDSLIAFLSSFFFTVLPYSIFYSRTILPEPAMLGMQLLSLWLFILWLQRSESAHSRRTLLLYAGSIATLALSLLIKPTAVFIAPVYLLLSFSYLGLGAIKSPWLWGYALLGGLPVVVWRQWIQQFPAGIPASAWLLNGNGIRLHPAWWRWLFADRIARLMTGYWGVVLLVAGAVAKLRTELKRANIFDQLTLVWAGSMFAYLVVFATGNVQHDYYQVLLTPIISLLMARGLVWLLSLPQKYVLRLVVAPMSVMILVLSLYFSWYEVRGYYQINNPAIVAAGQKVNQITPKDALVIAPYGGDTAFLFQTHRRGWPIGGTIDKFIQLGAEYYVTTTYDEEAKQLQQQYVTAAATNEYLILDLSSPIDSSFSTQTAAEENS